MSVGLLGYFSAPLLLLLDCSVRSREIRADFCPVQDVCSEDALYWSGGVELWVLLAAGTPPGNASG